MEEKKVKESIGIQLSASTALTFFWILNIIKEANPKVKEFLNFYKPVGPLLGLFIFSLIVLLISYQLLKSSKLTGQKSTYLIFLSSTIIFLLMVFPPIFEIVVDAIK